VQVSSDRGEALWEPCRTPVARVAALEESLKHLRQRRAEAESRLPP
jgi:hypothetical protein